jgi:hypothetical protein
LFGVEHVQAQSISSTSKLKEGADLSVAMLGET